MAFDLEWVSPQDFLQAKEKLEEFAKELEKEESYLRHAIAEVEMKKKKIDFRSNEMDAKERAMEKTSLHHAELECELAQENLALNAHRALIQIANVDVIEALDEILLQLELETDPKEVFKYMKRRREELEPKW